MRAALFFLALSCNSSSLGVPADGGVADGGGGDQGVPDLGGASCAQISTAMQTWIDGHLSCSRASDCALTTTNCGTPGQCGAYLQAAAVGGLMSIDGTWKSAGCMGPCPPCAFPAPATCNAGTCGALDFTDRPVGSPCVADGECHTEGQYVGQCLPFANGDCVLPCAHGFGCPLPGMACRPEGAESFCFAACTSDADCRASEGYLCCPQWGGLGEPGSVCHPSPCPT